MKRRRRYKLKKSIIILCIIFLVFFCGITFYLYKKHLIYQAKLLEEKRIATIKNSYSEYVITIKDSPIYDEDFNKVGTVSKDIFLSLDGINDEYFLIDNFDDVYYIKYTDVIKTDSYIDKTDNRYKNYIPYNENILTSNKTDLYDEFDNLVLSLDKDYSFPIIIKESEKYGVEYSNRVMYVQKKDGKVIDNNNTNLSNTKGIPVLNYHFMYKDDDKSCQEIICHSESLVRSHLDYIKDNKYFTPTMKELEMYIDNKIQLPKSVVITFDDGRYLNNVKNVIEEYKLNATFFIISGWRWNIDFANYQSDYLELHSHTHKMHDVGECPTGQGGAIQCFSEEKIQSDLKASRDTLYGTTYFAYPFYEYNDYSIAQLKKAGFTMAFGGYYENGYKYVKPGINKFKLPRLVIYNKTAVSTIKNYLELN